MRRLAFLAATLGLAVLPAVSSAAIVQKSGRVTNMAADQFPGAVIFSIDATLNSYCPPGQWLRFTSSNTDAMKGVYAFVLSAYLSGTTVTVAYDDTVTAASSSCNVTFVRGPAY